MNIVVSQLRYSCLAFVVDARCSACCVLSGSPRGFIVSKEGLLHHYHHLLLLLFLHLSIPSYRLAFAVLLFVAIIARICNIVCQIMHTRTHAHTHVQNKRIHTKPLLTTSSEHGFLPASLIPGAPFISHLWSSSTAIHRARRSRYPEAAGQMCNKNIKTSTWFISDISFFICTSRVFAKWNIHIYI